MKFKKLNSKAQVNVKVNDYAIDWFPAREVSKPQAAVKRFLYPFWRGKVCLEEFRIPSTLLRCDIICLTDRVAIEVSPRSSHSFNAFFDRNRFRFGAKMGREMDKVAWLEQNGFTVVEIFDEDIPLLSREWFREQGVEL